MTLCLILSRPAVGITAKFPRPCIDSSVLSCPADGRGDQQATVGCTEGHHGVQWWLRGGSSQTCWRGARHHDQAA